MKGKGLHLAAAICSTVVTGVMLLITLFVGSIFATVAEVDSGLLAGLGAAVMIGYGISLALTWITYTKSVNGSKGWTIFGIVIYSLTVLAGITNLAITSLVIGGLGLAGCIQQLQSITNKPGNNPVI